MTAVAVEQYRPAIDSCIEWYMVEYDLRVYGTGLR